MTGTPNPAAESVWRGLPVDVRRELESRLPPSELRSLLTSVADARAARVRPADLIERWRRDRFVSPALSDPRRTSAVEAQMWRLLPSGFASVELSPVAPLGSCAAVAPVSQNRIVTTMRLSEVVSDSTNALAIEASVRRLEQGSSAAVHLATAHRQLRAQVFGADAAAHFRLFALVSSARDAGSARTEAALLTRHLAYWSTVLEEFAAHRRPQIEYTVFDDPVLAERVTDTVLPAFESGVVRLVEDPSRTRGRGYYSGLGLRISVDAGASEIGDGGFTDWTARLTSSAKERCLISCIATERLADLTGTAATGDDRAGPDR
jgi:hypothetical protein